MAKETKEARDREEDSERITNDITLDPSTIELGRRLRGLDLDKVEELKSSMAEIGLLNPITVAIWGLHPRTHCQLVSGNHRLQAARDLGWEEIRARNIWAEDLPDSDIGVFRTIANKKERPPEDLLLLAQIDENLIRSNLSPAEEAKHLALRKELFERKGGSRCATPGGEQDIGFAKETSGITGVSKATINRSLHRAMLIAPDVLDDVVGTDLDSGVELDVLSGMCIEEQRFLAKEAKAGKPISAKLYETRFRDEDKAWAKRERTSRDIDHFCERAEKGIGKFIGTVNGNWRDELNELIKFKADIGTYRRKQLIQVLKYASARAEQAARNLEIESSPVDIVPAEPKMIEGGPE